MARYNSLFCKLDHIYQKYLDIIEVHIYLEKRTQLEIESKLTQEQIVSIFITWSCTTVRIVMEVDFVREDILARWIMSWTRFSIQICPHICGFPNFFLPPPPPPKKKKNICQERRVADFCFLGDSKVVQRKTCGSEVLIELETLLQIYEAQIGWLDIYNPRVQLTAGTWNMGAPQMEEEVPFGNQNF